VVRDGATAIGAEVVLGEVSAEGSVLVEGTRSLLSTGNFAVGLEHDGRLEVLSGARVESETGHLDFGLEGGETAFAKVGGKDAQGNRSTWTLGSLTIGPRGDLTVEDGGLVDVADELRVPSARGSVEGFSVQVFGQLSAGSVTLETGALLVAGDDGLLFVPQDIEVGSGSSPAELIVQGPASAPQIDAPDLLSVEGSGKVRLDLGARVNLLGSFQVGLGPASQARLEVLAGASGTGAPSLLRANEAENFRSRVGAESSAPAAEALAPTGTLALPGGRVELAGLNHSLLVDRRGLLRGRGGQLSIQAPGALVNKGVVDGDLVLEGDYVQEPQGTRRASILFANGPAAGPRALDPLAAARFPRRALRAKPALPAFGPLVVTGDATLDGRVELQFGNGVAPRLGDAFDVLDVAGTVTGSFAEVAIRGLVPGSFEFAPSLVGGKLTLTSMTDAAALPAVSVKAKARLKETAKRGGKIKLKRTGDTSAPLVVAYTVGGTAQSGVDYEALPGTIEFPAKKKSATIPVRPIADGLLEGPETLELALVPGDTYAPGAVSQVSVELLSKDE
jgi:T5SS/PEP-CTERM-associated repeat protein